MYNRNKKINVSVQLLSGEYMANDTQESTILS